MQKLNRKQQRFVDELAPGDKTGADAARLAGYSVKRPDVAAAKLLALPYVASALEERRSKLAKKIEVTQERIVRELAAIGFSNVRDLYDDKGNLKPLHTLDPIVAAQISGIEVEERGKKGKARIRKIRRWDKVSALIALGKTLDVFKDPNDKESGGTVIDNSVHVTVVHFAAADPSTLQLAAP